MKRIFSLVLVVLSLLVASSASAECLSGDLEMGPNCVHAEGRPGRDPMTTVYRADGTHVWDGVGTIVRSTAAYLLIEELVSDTSGVHWATVKHNWTGSVYER